jgi:hypothetical protein
LNDCRMRDLPATGFSLSVDDDGNHTGPNENTSSRIGTQPLERNGPQSLGVILGMQVAYKPALSALEGSYGERIRYQQPTHS